MATNGAPDSWDDDVETSTITTKFSDLNVEAPSFVPNVNAAVFVPSWEAQSAPPPVQVNAPSQVVESNQPSQATSSATNDKMQVGLSERTSLSYCKLL